MTHYLSNAVLAIILIFLFVIGFVFGATLPNNNSCTMEQRAQSNLAGLQEGFDKGFVSGIEFQQGADTTDGNADTLNHTWYFVVGYQYKTPDNPNIIELNPYKSPYFNMGRYKEMKI